MSRLLKVYLCLLTILLLLTNCRKKGWDDYYGRPDGLAQPIYQQLDARGNFKSFLKLAERAKYKDILSTGGYWTVFAPNDAAFEKFLKDNNYATINEGIDYKYVELVNKGTGKNYGLELSLERFFDKNFYFLVNGSLFDSKYKTLEGVWRNTRYNSNYIVNILFGKEFKNLGKKQNQTLALNTKVLFEGGERYIPLLRDAQGNVAVEPENDRYFDYSKAYNNKLDNIFLLNLSISYKFNRPRATHEIFLDMMNLTNSKGRVAEYYDVNKPGKVGYITQFGMFPNLMYRIYF